ncbi:MAG: proline--tRNA ligase [Spirochaetaceae bacterium]|nr:proline--tRNA ligase [Spirochaetaceae bacterium]
MKISETMIPTLREVPAEAVIASHQLMLRAGLLRKLGNGLFVYLPFGLRAFRKVENIIREEMDNIGALEFKQPVVVPGDIWKESGRWETMGAGMLKAVNRVDQELVVSPTAEEAFTATIRDELSSYKQLPIVAYQINTKYRDEIRPRYGVMRGREFTMKDAYSFHTTQESLDETYEKFAKAYRRIFKRLGLSVIPVRADSGAMGGSGSEEFMVESVVGDDTLILCPKCGYAANAEKAACAQDNPPSVKIDAAPEEIATPNVFSIEDMEKFFSASSKTFIKALIYKATNCALDLSKVKACEKWERVKDPAGDYYPTAFFCVLIRGDLDANEAKLASLVKASEVALAEPDEVVAMAGASHGFVGPRTLNCPIIADLSVVVQKEDGTFEAQIHDAIAGAGKDGFHVKHIEPLRDFTPYIASDVRLAKAGDKCPNCGAEFYSKKGNELGHIFKLGYKYTKTMNVTYLDENGKQQIPTMGCYGIGVDRALASIIEEHHDDNGIVWPMTVAPYQVAIVPVKYEGAMKEEADKIYDALQKAGIETLLDDRSERPGVKFKDIDLLGIPVRIVVGEKNLPNVELKCRNSADMQLVPATEAAAKAAEIVKAELAKLNG